MLVDSKRNELYILQDASNQTEIGTISVTVFITDDFSYGPETAAYEFKLKVVAPGQPTGVDKPVEPPPVQVVPEKAGFLSVSNQLPVAKIESLSSNGLLTIKFSKPIVEFPEDMKSLVDRNAIAYVESNWKTEPDMNAEPWISPLIILKLITSAETNKRFVKYSWYLEDYSKDFISLRLNFATPLKVS